MPLTLQNAIDSASTHEEKRRGYLGASAIGHDCPRHVQYYWLTLLGRLQCEPVEPRVRRIFERGNIYEAEMVKWMSSAGFKFEQNDDYLHFSDFGDKFKGHVDGILLSGPIELPYPLLWECKCVNDNGFNRLKELRVKRQYPKYYTQIQLYMGYCKLQNCLFSVVNANTMEIYSELVAFDKAHYDEMVARVQLILDKTALNKLVPKVPNNWNCRYCEYSEVCNGLCS